MDSEPHHEPKVARIESISAFINADGDTVLEAHARTNMSEEELRETYISASGSDPEDVTIQSIDEADWQNGSSRRRRVVGFTRWNSSWEPGEPKGDPSLN